MSAFVVFRSAKERPFAERKATIGQTETLPGEAGHRPGVFASSELEGRFGARILPEWMDIVDDPTQTEWRSRPNRFKGGRANR